MTQLPTAPPSCALDPQGLRTQLERYRESGRGASVVERSARELSVQLRPDVATGLVDELVAVERDCCPFFTIGWDPGERRLSVSVSRRDDEPALAAVAFALGLEAAAHPAPQ